MKKDSGQRMSATRKAAIASDVSATAARLSREAEPTEPVADDQLLTDLLDSVVIDDLAADQLWADLPPTELDDSELIALAADASRRAGEGAAVQPLEPSPAGDERTSSIAKKLRGPRHPFE